MILPLALGHACNGVIGQSVVNGIVLVAVDNERSCGIDLGGNGRLACKKNSIAVAYCNVDGGVNLGILCKIDLYGCGTGSLACKLETDIIFLPRLYPACTDDALIACNYLKTVGALGSYCDVLGLAFVQGNVLGA